MKKRNIVIAVILTLCIALSALMTACILDPAPSKTTSGGTSNSQLVAMSATSSALILDEMQQNPAVAKALNLGGDDTLEGKPLTDEEIEEVKAQLAILENYMGENAISLEQGAPAEDDEYYGVYEIKMTVSTKNLEGETTTFTMYFNQTETKNNKQEIEMKSYENGQIFQCKYEKKTRNGKDYIEAEVMKDGRMIEVFITVEGSGTEEDPYRHVYTYGEYEDLDD